MHCIFDYKTEYFKMIFFQREALDRLSTQILSIQDKVYEAAIKSVDSLGARMLPTRACKFPK